ncbi:putative leucine-rich repeat-containing protein DDB_G0290503 [Linepithema humile]|uniref:putative leucine-rich repeat-containing protein DDB_G0290503 n=1 Tax=Linepithema humile TaxID=83485 RepID=UPI00351E6CC4
MHFQFGDEDEFEPRSTPKPVAKLDSFAIPTVPEISLIFEKPTAQNPNDRSSNSSPARLLKPIIQLPDNTVRHTTSTSPILSNSNSYAAWREQNYSKQINPTTSISSSCKNTYSNNRTPQPCLQDVSIQKQQRQDKISDLEKRIINARANDKICEKSVKFRCPNVNDSYDEAQLSLSNKKHLPCNSLQRAMYSVPDCTTRVPSETIPDTLKKAEHVQIPHTAHQQCHAPNYSNYNVDNNETVKTLLQLVNSQNEQIKTLQLQVDRLVRIQEENYRNKSTCPCSQSLANQVFRYPPINCYDTAFSSSIAQSQNQGTKKNTGSQNASVVEKKDLESFSENNKLLEQQSKKTFVEQKVSIGVMTSFEFTVQNSPFLIDSGRNEKKEVHRENNNINRRNAINAHDTTESVQRYKNTFTCKPGAALLENIVEDSESYLSSSQQQSSNFNASSYVKDSERHTPRQSDSFNVANTLESSKMYQCLATDLNRRKMQEGMFIGENSNIDEQIQNSNKMLSASMNVNYSPAESANYSKALISDVNDYTTINGEKSTDKMNTNKHPLRNIHLPATDYYQNHRIKEHCDNAEQTKDMGDSMILNGDDLKVFERPPTPEPSIHVEMQEYTSDDESDKQKRTSKIGWTFYNNVLGQVNEILQNSSVIENKDYDDVKVARRVEQENDTETRTALNTVKAATLEQLRRLGISLTDNEHRESNGNNKTMDFDSSFYPRLDRQANMIHTTTTSVNETNTSMHMRALALKYLSDEQLADIALHKQESSSLKHLMVSNMQGTNMSLATMRYLERYQLLPGKNNVQAEDNLIYEETVPKRDFKPLIGKNNPAVHRFPFVQTPGTTCPSKILDLSTIKRQPKLL